MNKLDIGLKVIYYLMFIMIGGIIGMFIGAII